jgi:hypothetical protein
MGVLLFRAVASSEEHLGLSRALGELEVHPLERMRAEESPYFMKVGTDPGVRGARVHPDGTLGKSLAELDLHIFVD